MFKRNSIKVFAALFFAITQPLLSHAQDQIENIEKYHENSKWQKSTAIELFQHFANHQDFKGTETLIDICSGDGKITATMAEYFPNGKVIGSDLSSKMVEFAKTHYTKDAPNLSFETMNANQLSFANKADVMTSFTCMHLIEDQPAVLKGMYQNLQDHGKLLMVFPVVHGFDKALQKTTSLKKWRAHFNQFNPGWYFVTAKEYEQLLKNAGFTIKHLEVFTKDETYPSREAFADSIGHWLPHVKVLNPKLQTEFINDLVTIYLEQVALDDKGELHYYVDNLVVEAVKG
jgi:trans-aconitate 2-methyltransferase